MNKKRPADNYSQTYIKFLNMTQAIRELPTFPRLDAVEEQLLNAFAAAWGSGRMVRVLEAMEMFPSISGSTVHRRLDSLRKKGMIALNTDDENQRVKYIVPTMLTEKYFAKLGECLSKAIKA
ncbi:MAG TPA: hypothetical protein VIU46_05400 [Gallionellaceae bacterium]